MGFGDEFGGFGGLEQITDWINPGSQPTPAMFSGGAEAGGGFLSGLGGLGGFMSGIGDVARTVAPIAGLASTGLGMYGGIQGMLQGAEQQKMMKQAQKQQQQIAAPASAAGAALTGAGQQAMMGGPLPSQLEALAASREAELRNQIRSYFAHAGIQDSTMMAEYEGWIKQQTDLYRAQLAQNLLQSGYQGIQTASGANQPIMSSAMGQMGQTEKSLAGANQAIAMLTGSQDDRRRKQQAEA